MLITFRISPCSKLLSLTLGSYSYYQPFILTKYGILLPSLRFGSHDVNYLMYTQSANGVTGRQTMAVKVVNITSYASYLLTKYILSIRVGC